jgi:hypothetical protein
MTSLPRSRIRIKEWLSVANLDKWQTMAKSCKVVLQIITISLVSACHSLPIEKPPLIEGIVWQLDNTTIDARGNWHDIGAKTLLIQWISVDGIQFMHDENASTPRRLPDWSRIGKEPWAQEVILGLAGRFDETAARADVAGLITESVRLANLPKPLNVAAWYFPVEVDSSWGDAEKLGQLLAQLPRPLWISVYDSRNIGAIPFAQWLSTWLPKDVGIFFQDGVGVHARNATVARQYVEAILHQLGTSRVKVIAEAFRPKADGGFRSATLDELTAQLSVYRGLPIYLFDGPHYVSNALVEGLKNTFNK